MSIIRSNPFGGTHGLSFDDSNYVDAWGRITQIVVRHGDRVDSIGVAYDNGHFINHGGTGGSESVINLKPDEFISKINGRSGDVLDQIILYSNRGLYRSFGGQGGTPFTVDFSGKALLYLFGRAGDEIDQIGFGYGDPPPALPISQTVVRSIGHGGTGGNPFDDLDPFNLSGLGNQKITSITVGHGDYVDYIGVGGSGDNWPSSGSGHGGYEGQMDTFSLDDDEWLTEIHGRSGSYLDQVVFYLNSGHVSPVYGGYGGVPFIEKMDKGIIKAFFGRSGSYVDQLGVYFAKLGPTPVLVTPVNGQTFKRFHTARKTTLIWRPVADPAAGYYVEVQYLLQPGDWKPLTSQSIQGTSLTFDFPGAYPGRWRVSAAGHFSEWWSFTYAV